MTPYLSPKPRKRATPLNTLAKRHTPAELERRMADHADPLGKLTDADRRAVSRQAVLYRDLENEELLAPTVTQAWDKLQDYATAPAGRRPSMGRLRGALSGLVEAGVLSTPEAEGIVITYRQGWDEQRQAQSADLSTSIAGRTYRQAQAVALLAEVETLNAESDPIENGLSNEQRRYYTALRGAYADNVASLLNEASLSRCNVSPDGSTPNPSAVIRPELRGDEVCARYAVQIEQERQKVMDLGSSLTLGRVDAAARVRGLAGRKARGSATPQEEQEFLTYFQVMDEDALAPILGALS